VVSREPLSPADLRGRRVAIPGHTTTAWLVLRMIESGAVPVVVPIVPFGRMFEALDAGEVEAALLIHEGRLLYERRGYHKVVDVGEWWDQQTQLPLPLGVNVIRKALGPALVARVSGVLRAAIDWALAHRAEVITALAGEERGEAALAQAALLDRYLGMYANEDTRGMASDVRQAVEVLFARARAAGLLAGGGAVEWAP
jgi:1,4-dihydroxy-6-naphthoate synthase